MKMKEIPGSEFELDCDLCLLALGFVHPEHPGPIEQLA
jgi:glutamate synthase (NADPH/NADH) small chain